MLALDINIDAFKELNMPKNFNYDLGNANEGKLPEFICDNIMPMIKDKV